MSRGVAWGIAKRSLILIPRVPSTFVPSVVMPIFLTAAFAGAFSGLVLIPGFPAETALDWFIPMTTMQGGAFAGVTTGMGVARDLENGFYDRLLLSPASRVSLLTGPIAASVFRGLIPLTILLAVAVVSGAHFKGGMAGVGTLAIAALGMALIAGTWSVALALKFKTMQVAPLMQTGVFMSIFLSTAQMPLPLLTGWLQEVARYNPITKVLDLGRQGFLGPVSWARTWPGLVALACMSVGMALFAYRQMKRVVP